MEALNIEAEYRKLTSNVSPYLAQQHANGQVARGLWVEDDGDYYTREEWDAEEERLGEEYEQRILQEQAEHEEREAAEGNFRSWLDETEPEYLDRIGH